MIHQATWIVTQPLPSNIQDTWYIVIVCALAVLGYIVVAIEEVLK